MTAEHCLYELILLFYFFLFFFILYLYGLRYHYVNEIKADTHCHMCVWNVGVYTQKSTYQN